MFNQYYFAYILKQINNSYDTMTDFGKSAAFDRTYISKYINQKLSNPPTPKILEKIAKASHGITTYEELMIICGYLNENIEKELTQKLKKLELNLPDLEKSITAFIENYITLPENYTTHIYDETNSTSYYAYELITNMYFKLRRKKIRELCTISSINTNNSSLDKIPEEIQEEAEIYATNKIQNILNNLDIPSILSDLTEEEKAQKFLSTIDISNKFYMCPILGKISAGVPNWSEECIEGHIPIDPDLMGIVNPEEHFFLKVNGESMNKIIRNGAYALIHKQDYVDDGDIAVVLVNDNEATLKKFSIQGDFISLMPESYDDSFKQQIYTKADNIKVIGKYVGKMEFN